MVPALLFALRAIVPQTTAIHSVLSRPPVVVFGSAPSAAAIGDLAREAAVPGKIEIRVCSSSTWTTQGFALRREGGTWSGWRLDPTGWIERPVSKETIAATLRALRDFERWPDSPPLEVVGNDVPRTTVQIVREGRYRAFAGLAAGTREARELARLVREAVD